jgi:diguanylate cyclase (GGDEF)-like protein
MAKERSPCDGGARPGKARIRVSTSRSAALAAVFTVAAAVATVALVSCLRRTSRLAREMDKLAHLSRTDPLTGLPNRRHVGDHLAVAVSAARRHQHPLSVLFVDVDGFKRVNDQLGYEAGDEVLRAVSDRMRHALRAEDLVGRWGGEEFVAVLPATDLAGAVVVAERVRTSIAGEPIAVAKRHPRVTVSVGCASGAGEPAELILQAGQALGQAKRAGKNRVVAADQD